MKIKLSMPPVVGVALFAIVTNASADVINASSAVASSTYPSPPKVVENLINGSGLSGGATPVLSQTHDNNGNADTMWHAAAGTQSQNEWLEFTLPPLSGGQSYTLENIHIWQHNQFNRTQRGIKSFDLWVSSTASGDDFVPADTDLTMPQAAGTGPISVQTFTLANPLTNVRRVKFDIDESWDGPDKQYVGLSEVRFGATVVTTYASWKSVSFPEETLEADREPAADLDQDGVTNLLEYGLGTNPAVSSTMPTATSVIDGENSYLQLQWSRPIGRSDITTVGEVSPDLTENSWSSEPADVSTVISAPESGMETITIRMLSPLGASSRKFLHTKILLTEEAPPS